MKRWRKIVTVIFCVLLIADAFVAMEYMFYINGEPGIVQRIAGGSGNEEDETESVTEGGAEGGEANDDAGPQSETEEVQSRPFSFANISGMTLMTEEDGLKISITIQSDGTFSGTYERWHEDDATPLYPDGSVECAEFSGSLSDPGKKDDGAESFTVESVRTERTEGTSEVRSGILYRFSIPEGFGLGEEWTVIAAGAGIAGIENTESGIALRIGSGE